MALHKGQQRGQRPGLQLGVWIEQKEVTSPRLGESLIIPSGKPDILRVREHLHLREINLQHPEGVIARSIIDHDDLCVQRMVIGKRRVFSQRLQFAINGLEALLEQIANVPTDDQKGKVHFLDILQRPLHDILSQLRHGPTIDIVRQDGNRIDSGLRKATRFLL